MDPELVRRWPNGPEGFTDAMNRLPPAFWEHWSESSDGYYRLAVLEAGQNPRWQNPEGPVPYDEFRWENFWSHQPSGLNKGLEELNIKMNRSAFLRTKVGTKRPIVFFLLHGETLEQQLPECEMLRQNRWLQHAAKIVLVLNGRDACDALEQVTGEVDMLIRTETPEATVKWLKTLLGVLASEKSIGRKRDSVDQNTWDRLKGRAEQLLAADEEEIIPWTDSENDFD